MSKVTPYPDGTYILIADVLVSGREAVLQTEELRWENFSDLPKMTISNHQTWNFIQTPF